MQNFGVEMWEVATCKPRRLEDNINMDLRKIDYNDVNKIGLAEKINTPSKIRYITLFQDPTLSGANIFPTSEVLIIAMLV
jgi:hypothetical protein